MKRFGNIYEKIYDMENLRQAHLHAREDKLFYKEVRMVDSDPDYYLGQIREMLMNETYEVSPYTVSYICDKGKVRKLEKLPYFPDRIIQWAIMLQIEEVFMSTFCHFTCSSIKNRGIKKAVDLTKSYLKDKENTKYALKMDITKFYPSINHSILEKLLLKKFKDIRLLNLLYTIIDSTPDRGVPIGSYLSQYLANFYLTYFDHWMKEVLHIDKVVRYMDDVIILSKFKELLHIIVRKVDEYLRNALDLQLKPNWQIFPIEARGLDFVGFVFYHDYILIKKITFNKMKGVFNSIKEKCSNGNMINRHEFLSANSYIGIMRMADAVGSFNTYMKPIMKDLIKYYTLVICKNKTDKKQRVIRYERKFKKKGWAIV